MQPRMKRPSMSNSERIRPILKFSSRKDAFDFVNNRATRPLRVILGSDRKFWIVTPAQAEKLQRRGFELAN